MFFIKLVLQKGGQIHDAEEFERCKVYEPRQCTENRL